MSILFWIEAQADNKKPRFRFKDTPAQCQYPASFYENKMVAESLRLHGLEKTQPEKAREPLPLENRIRKLFSKPPCDPWVDQLRHNENAKQEDLDQLRDAANESNTIPLECFAAAASDRMPAIRNFNKNGKILSPTCKNLPDIGYPLCFASDQNMNPKQDSAWCDHVPYTVHRPCLSTAWATLMQESLKQVSFCMAKAYDRDPEEFQKELFWMWSQESGFIPNARSQSEVYGVAQVSASAIHQLSPDADKIKSLRKEAASKIKNAKTKNNKLQIEWDMNGKIAHEQAKLNEWSELNDRIPNSVGMLGGMIHSTECRQVKDTIQRFSKGNPNYTKSGIGGNETERQEKGEAFELSDDTCSRVSIPPNPLASMLYGAQYSLKRQSGADQVFDSVKKVVGKRGLTREMKKTIAYHFYNGGSELEAVYVSAAKICLDKKNWGKQKTGWGCILSKAREKIMLLGNSKSRNEEIRDYPSAIAKLESKINSKDDFVVNGERFECEIE